MLFHRDHYDSWTWKKTMGTKFDLKGAKDRILGALSP